MYQLEVFFDYTCPFCKRGHEYLLELLPAHPDVEPVWRPCEAHPRPESHGLHSDLCIQGMFFVLDAGANLHAYHERMYKAAVDDRSAVNIEDIDTLVSLVEDLVDPAAFRAALESGKYADVQRKSNEYAYLENGVHFIPSYRMAGKALDSVGGVGVAKEQLDEFMGSAR